MLVYIQPVILLLSTPRHTPKSLLIEHASSMHRHASVLMQAMIYTAIENTSSACTHAILNVKHHRSYVYTHARTRAILHMCQVV